MLTRMHPPPVDAFGVVLMGHGSTGIRVVDGADLVQSEAFDNVVYSGVDSTDKKRFAYLTHYTRLGIIFCHVFSMKKVRIRTIRSAACSPLLRIEWTSHTC